jgi:outer membrane protein assembly factor BamB
MAQAYTAYCVDIRTGALVWGPTAYANNTAIFGSYNAGKNGPVFAHGYVWFYASNNIVRLNPATGAVTTAQAVTAAGGLQWVGDVLYYWDLSTKHIFSVPKADLGV